MTPGAFTAAIVTAIVGLAIPIRAADPSIADPDVVVRESHGTYSVVARFHVARTPEVAMAALTDYERIPQFMPGMESSVVVERSPGRTIVVQEAISHLMMFKKRVRLVLEIDEAANTLHFRDRCGQSFTRYEGAWRLSQGPDGTEIVYDLTARPAFDVPEFVLKRLLKRDSGLMIEGLRREIERRPVSGTATPNGSVHDEGDQP